MDGVEGGNGSRLGCFLGLLRGASSGGSDGFSSLGDKFLCVCGGGLSVCGGSFEVVRALLSGK